MLQKLGEEGVRVQELDSHWDKRGLLPLCPATHTAQPAPRWHPHQHGAEHELGP